MTSAKLSIESLREAHERARLSLEIIEMEATSRVATAIEATDQSSWVDPRGYLYDDNERWASLLGQGMYGDNRQNGQRTIYQSEEDLAAIRGSARYMCSRHPAAIAAIENLTSYVIADGFAYKIVTDDPQRLKHEPLVPAVQELVDEFLDRNDWVGLREAEVFRQSREDGEAFVSLYDRGDYCDVRIVEPEYVTAPNSDSELANNAELADGPVDSRYGILTDPHDVCRVLGYHVAWDSLKRDTNVFLPQYCEHIKLNALHGLKRGVSDFYPVYDHLERVEKIVRNFGEAIKLLSAIAFIREHAAGTTSTQADAMRVSSATRQYQTTYPAGAQTRYEKRYDPGTVLDVSNGLKYSPPPIGEGHGDTFIQIEQAILRFIGVRWCMPEYMISGDASNNNRASALEAGLPFVRFCQRQQAFYARKFSNIVWKAIRFAYNRGRFSNYNLPFGDQGWRELQSLIDLKVEVPSIAIRDPLKETERNRILSSAGILSDSSWAAREGINYDQEQAAGAEKPELTDQVVKSAKEVQKAATEQWLQEYGLDGGGQ